MSLWAFIILALVLQETATATVAFTLAVQNHSPLWVIHVLWAAITIFDMYLGYHFGTLVREHYRGSRIVRWAEMLVEKLRKPLGRYGDKLVLGTLAIFDFPYLNTIIASWLGTEMRTSFAFTFIGNAIWYALLWMAILGANTFLSGPTAMFFVIIILGVLSYFTTHEIEKRMK